MAKLTTKQTPQQSYTSLLSSMTSPLTTTPKNDLSFIKTTPMPTSYTSGGLAGTPKVPVYTAPTPTSSNTAATGTVKTSVATPTKPSTNTSSLPSNVNSSNYVDYLLSQNNGSVLGSTASAGYADPATAYGATQQKVTPQTTARDDFINAFKQYQQAQTNTADVTAAKQAYNDFVANLAKSKAGLEGQGRGIPLTLVRGQQEKLLGQNQPEAARLQGDISIAQDAYNANVAGAKGGVDSLATLMGLEEKTGTTPATVQEYEYAKSQGYTGSFAQYQNEDANRKATANSQFTLGKDQVRYDAAGNVIAQGSGAAPQGQSEVSKNVVSVIEQLLGNPALSKISGVVDQFIGGLQGQPALVKNQYNQLKGLLSLDNIKYLKGTGAISDAEQRLLANAATALGRNLSDKDFRNELVKLRDGLMTASASQTSGTPQAGSSIYNF
jgi:hypothetical protein